MGDVYCAEENLENAYVLYLKYLTLFVEKLPRHPGTEFAKF
jgi:STAM-binding protein